MSIVKRGSSRNTTPAPVQDNRNSRSLFDQLPAKLEYAKVLAEADLVPEAFRRKPGNILIALDMAADLDISPMAALTGINVIQGKPSPSPELMRALLHRAGHRLRVTENTSTVCQVELTRADDPEHTHVERFTIDDAQQAGIAGGANWGKYPARMLLARATGNAVKTHAPDVLLGMTVALDDDPTMHTPVGPTADLETGEVLEEPQEPRLRRIPVEGDTEPEPPADTLSEPDVEDAEVVPRVSIDAWQIGRNAADTTQVSIDRDVMQEELRSLYKACDAGTAAQFKEWRAERELPVRFSDMTNDQLMDTAEWFDRAGVDA